MFYHLYFQAPTAHPSGEAKIVTDSLALANFLAAKLNARIESVDHHRKEAGHA